MAHKAQRDFCAMVKDLYPLSFKGVRVLDVGSLDINGCNRPLFEGCEYVGLDIAAGRNVDRVGFGHAVDYPDGYFDTIISTECFEHDFYFDKTFKNIVRMLRKNGLFLMTCATTGRAEHGTVAREPNDSPLTIKIDHLKSYYNNLVEADFRAVMDIDAVFYSYQFSVLSDVHDLQFWGIKR